MAPCNMRQTISQAMLEASAAPRLAATINASDTSSTGRRPKRSATGPQTSCIRPKARISADIVICIADSGAANSRAISGSAGRYRSVITGCRPSSSASSVAACRTLSTGGGANTAPVVGCMG